MSTYLHHHDLPNDIEFKTAIAVDTEAMGLNIMRDRLCLIQISQGDGNVHIVKFDSNFNAPNLVKILTNDQILKIFHFARFDMAILFHYLNINFSNIYCTKIASRLARTYTESHGLKNLCEELLGIEISKKQQSSDWGNKNLSDKQLDYASSDVLYLHQIKDKLNEIIIREHRQELLKDCLKFLPTRVKLDLVGFSNIDIFSHS
ncbi:3'-5' exonuclease [Alphaproteobacteria bacterium]|nr:3'-5' exonuclease [Alphaproteobacteria bacterium]